MDLNLRHNIPLRVGSANRLLTCQPIMGPHLRPSSNGLLADFFLRFLQPREFYTVSGYLSITLISRKTWHLGQVTICLDRSWRHLHIRISSIDIRFSAFGLHPWISLILKSNSTSSSSLFGGRSAFLFVSILAKNIFLLIYALLVDATASYLFIEVMIKFKKNKLNLWLTAPRGATPVN